MVGIRSKHDEFFKAMMKNLSIAQDFFKTRLPQKVLNLIDLPSIRIEEASFIDKELNGSESDVLFSVNCANSEKKAFLYVLCEHQSSSDALMPFRLMYYTLQILRRYVALHENDELPLPFVYPLVVYNGKRPWSHDRSFFGQFGDLSGLAQEILIQPFPLLDAATLDEVDLRRQHISNLMLASLRHTKNQQELEKKLRLVSELFSNCGIKASSDLSHSVLHYLAESISADGQPIDFYWVILKKGFTPEYREVVMNLIEATRQEAMQQGMQQGMQLGEKNNTLKVATNLLQADIDLTTISECTGLSVEQVRALEEEAKAH